MYPILFKDTFFVTSSFEFMMMMAALIAGFVVYKMAPRNGLSQKVVLDLAIYGTLAALVGGRLFHVFVELPYDPELLKQGIKSYYYFDNPIRILQVWKGGWASHGAFIGLALSWFIYLKKHKLNILQYLDHMCLYGGPFVIIFVRLGCLLAGCCYGKPSPFDKFEYILYIHLHHANRWPTQIYSMLYGVLIFLICLGVKNIQTFRGQVMVSFLFFYGLFRSSIEFLRADADRGIYFNGAISTGQIVGIIYLILCVVFYFYFNKRFPISENDMKNSQA
ncbi:MAG: prolipoprotein diacylglyceryl transferase [Deltaproteobacteria bacterium]|nr:prolipoprotein diacylglyceryl transferase [Deltaproteobacteria bacterium]